LLSPFAAVVVTAPALVAVAAPPNGPGGPGCVERMQRRAADEETVLEAKLAGMKGGLKLTPDRE